jgi:serine/threonine protein kinase
MKDVARAVKVMHEDDIMHRDIKPDNILHRTIGTCLHSITQHAAASHMITLA